MENKDWIRYDLDDIVFEYRNKQYGAYILRKQYGQHIRTASFWGISAFLLLIMNPIIADKMNNGKNFGIDEKNVLYELPETKKPEPIPPPKPELPKPPPPKKQIATQDFRPPVVKDNPVEEPIIPKIEDIKVAVSNKTQDGEKVDLPPIEVPEVPISETKSKNTVSPKDTDGDDEVILIVQQKPEFENGDKAMYEFIAQHIHYPEIARQNAIEGTVFIGFVVSKDGSIRDVVVKRGIGGGCNEEAIRVIKMMPKWKPGKQNGKPVNVAFTLPVKFKLT